MRAEDAGQCLLASSVVQHLGDPEDPLGGFARTERECSQCLPASERQTTIMKKSYA